MTTIRLLRRARESTVWSIGTLVPPLRTYWALGITLTANSCRTMLRSTRNMLRSIRHTWRPYHRLGVGDCCGRRTCTVVSVVLPVAIVAARATLAVALSTSQAKVQMLVFAVVVDVQWSTSTAVTMSMK